MSTLIIPCAGKSSRFPGMKPKWMLRYPDGKIMVEKAVEGLDTDAYERIIVTIVKEHAEKYNADIILNKIFKEKIGKKFQLCILDEFTTCQAETILKTLDIMNVQGAFAVKDSDNYIKVDVNNNNSFVVGLNINRFTREIARLNQKSFLIVNEQGIITDIIEKRIKSECVCVGMYGFESGELFHDAYNHLRDVSSDRYEIYLSHIISYIIGMKKEVYQCVYAEDYEDWGTIKDWNIVLDEKQTYLINMDNLLFEIPELPYLEQLVLNPIGGNIEMIKAKSDNGAQIIILTSMPDRFKSDIEKALIGQGIKAYRIVTGCYLSHKTLMEMSDRTIPYPGSTALNIGYNNSLKDYMI